jgi:hypothetical protein
MTNLGRCYLLTTIGSKTKTLPYLLISGLGDKVLLGTDNIRTLEMDIYITEEVVKIGEKTIPIYAVNHTNKEEIGTQYNLATCNDLYLPSYTSKTILLKMLNFSKQHCNETFWIQTKDDDRIRIGRSYLGAGLVQMKKTNVIQALIHNPCKKLIEIRANTIVGYAVVANTQEMQEVNAITMEQPKEDFTEIINQIDKYPWPDM